MKLIVLSSVPPPPLSVSDDNSDDATSITPPTKSTEYVLDQLDDFNHPRQRRDIILNTLQQEQCKCKIDAECNFEIIFDVPSSVQVKSSTSLESGNDISTIFHDVYSTVHSTPMLTFLESAWKKWLELGPDGRDPIGCSTVMSDATTSTGSTTTKTGTGTGTSTVDDVVTMNDERNIPSLIPACTPLLRCHNSSSSCCNSNMALKQRASKHVIGQMSYYCTDSCTPIFQDLIQEIYNDTVLVQTCLDQIKAIGSTNDGQDNESIPAANHTVFYIIPNHPGHHAAYDCFGGYCYVNHIAALAKNIINTASSLSTTDDERVVILDVDYHCGNGTAAIFQQDGCCSDNVLVISIHCDPDYDYPFHMGFRDDSTQNVIHLPLPPGTGWETGYRTALLQAIDYINEFVPTTLLVSLGIDTYDEDPCTIRRAGFTLQLTDYIEMGALLATNIVAQQGSIGTAATSPPLRRTIFVQEGGYRMDIIGEAAKNVVVSYTQHK